MSFIYGPRRGCRRGQRRAIRRPRLSTAARDIGRARAMVTPGEWRHYALMRWHYDSGWFQDHRQESHARQAIDMRWYSSFLKSGHTFAISTRFILEPLGRSACTKRCLGCCRLTARHRASPMSQCRRYGDALLITITVAGLMPMLPIILPDIICFKRCAATPLRLFLARHANIVEPGLLFYDMLRLAFIDKDDIGLWSRRPCLWLLRPRFWGFRTLRAWWFRRYFRLY